MALLAGNAADIYAISGTGTTMTGEATTLLSGTTYQITDTAKRIIDPTSAVTVYDGVTTLTASQYELVYPIGKIVLASAPGGAVTITGKYLTAAQVAQCTKWTFSGGPTLVMTATFGDTWEESTAVQQKGSATLTRFAAVDELFFSSITGPFLLLLYEKQSSGARYAAVGYAETSREAAEGAVQTEGVTFSLTGWVDYAAT